MKYGTILADPPWPEHGGGKIKRGADRHYALMKVKDIIKLPVADLALPNSHLYLWVTNNYLRQGLQVMALWGYRYITMITWAKPSIGLGQYFRGQTEHCLFGMRGVTGYKVVDGKRGQGTTLIQAPKARHSQKPEELRRMIERVSPGPYLEMFARGEAAPGWDVWGNEVTSSIDVSVYGFAVDNKGE